MSESSLVISYGGGETLGYVFNAIAALFNSAEFKKTLYIAGVLMGFWQLIFVTIRHQALSLFLWLGWFILIMQLVLLPKVNVKIYDPLTKYERVVANVPYLLGNTASWVSRMGDSFTRNIEGLFVLPDYLPYHETGSVFASKLFRQMGKLKVHDDVLKGNLYRFIQNCVVYDALIGHKYTLSDLRNSANILELVSDTSPLFGFPYQVQVSQDGKNVTAMKIVSCQEGIASIKKSLDNEVKTVATIVGKSFGLKKATVKDVNDAIGTEFLTKLTNSYKLMTGISETGSALLKQEIMINSIPDANREKLEELGRPQSYGAAKALLQQRSTYNTVGDIASRVLSVMKVVFEVLIYSAFMFVPMLVLLPSGFSVLGNYLGMFVWIQLWAPFYAVLNLVMTVSGMALSRGSIEGKGLTMLTSHGYSNLHMDLESTAAMLSMSVPFISYVLLKGGVSSLMHLAGTLSSGYQAASASVAGELTSGNVSMGNVSYRTSAHDTHSSNKHDSNFMHQAGRMELASGDGSLVFRTQAGRVGFRAGAGITTSSWDQQLNLQSNLSSSLSNARSLEESNVESLSKEVSAAESDTMRTATNYFQRLSESGSHSSSRNVGYGVEESTNISSAKQFMEDLQRRHGYSSQQAAEVAASLSIGGGIGETKAGINTSFKSQSDFQDAVNKGRHLSESMGITDSISNAVRTGDQFSFGENKQIEQALGKDVARSYDNLMSKREALSSSKQKLERISKAANYAESNGFTLNQELQQEVLDRLAKNRVPTGENMLDHPPAELGYDGARKEIMNHSPRYYATVRSVIADKAKQIEDIAPSLTGTASFDTISEADSLSKVGGANSYEAPQAIQKEESSYYKQSEAEQATMHNRMNQGKEEGFYQEKYKKIKKEPIKENYALGEEQSFDDAFEKQARKYNKAVTDVDFITEGSREELRGQYNKLEDTPKLNNALMNAPKSITTHKTDIENKINNKEEDKLKLIDMTQFEQKPNYTPIPKDMFKDNVKQEKEDS